MKEEKVRTRQLVDWSSAWWAGLLSGSIFFLLNVFLAPQVLGGNAWVMVRLFASVVLGEGVLAPPATFDATVCLAAFLSQLGIAILCSLILAYVVHRGNLLTGIVVGVLFGLALYVIHFYTLTMVFPWFFAMRSWVFLLTHAVFGALAGGIYEWLEVEEFVPVEEDEKAGAV